MLVDYKKKETKYVREEPTMRKIGIDKKGVVNMEFSTEIIWPRTWQDKYRDDSKKAGSRLLEKKIPFLEAKIK